MDASLSTLGLKGTCHQWLTVFLFSHLVAGSGEVIKAGLEFLKVQEIFPWDLCDGNSENSGRRGFTAPKLM